MRGVRQKLYLSQMEVIQQFNIFERQHFMDSDAIKTNVSQLRVVIL